MKELDDIDKLELQECYSAIRAFLEKRVQLISFFGTAALTILGLAFNFKRSDLVMAAGGILLLFMLVDAMIRVNLAGYLYTSYRIEIEKLGRHGLIYTHILSHSGRIRLLKEFQNLKDMDDEEKLSKRLRRMFRNPFGFRTGAVSWIVLCMIVLLLILCGFLFWVGGWPFLWYGGTGCT